MRIASHVLEWSKPVEAISIHVEMGLKLSSRFLSNGYQRSSWQSAECENAFHERRTASGQCADIGLVCVARHQIMAFRRRERAAAQADKSSVDIPIGEGKRRQRDGYCGWPFIVDELTTTIDDEKEGRQGRRI